MIVRKGSTAESSSIITRDQFKIVEYLPQIDQDTNGQPLVSADVVVLISLPRRESNGEAHVLFRGVSPAGIDLRPQVSLVAGRWFTPGKREVVVSRRLAGRFANFDIGSKFKIASKELTVVGWSDGRNSAFVQQRVVALRGEEGLQATYPRFLCVGEAGLWKPGLSVSCPSLGARRGRQTGQAELINASAVCFASVHSTARGHKTGEVLPLPLSQVVSQFAEALRKRVFENAGAEALEPGQQRREVAQALIEQCAQKLEVFLPACHQFGGGEVVDFQRPNVG